jgi:hypothetical protein
MKKLSNWIYYKLLPIYIPRERAHTERLHFAVWCCIDCKKSGNLLDVMRGMRITVRKNHRPKLVVKRGEI